MKQKQVRAFLNGFLCAFLIIDEAQKQAGMILAMAFLFAGLKTHIESDIVINNETFHLSFTKK